MNVVSYQRKNQQISGNSRTIDSEISVNNDDKAYQYQAVNAVAVFQLYVEQRFAVQQIHASEYNCNSMINSNKMLLVSNIFLHYK